MFDQLILTKWCSVVIRPKASAQVKRRRLRFRDETSQMSMQLNRFQNPNLGDKSATLIWRLSEDLRRRVTGRRRRRPRRPSSKPSPEPKVNPNCSVRFNNMLWKWQFSERYRLSFDTKIIKNFVFQMRTVINVEILCFDSEAISYSVRHCLSLSPK